MGAASTSNNITHTASTNSFQVSQAGTYFISCYAYVSSTYASGLMQLIGSYSTNGSSWSNVLVSTYGSSGLGSSIYTVVLQGIYTMAARSYFDVQIYSTLPSAVSFNTTAPNSYFYMYRIG